MANDLNSILIEGTVEGNPTLSVADVTRCSFAIRSKRFYKTEDCEYHEEVAVFQIKSMDHFAVWCLEKLKTDSRVRVVGRLAKDADSVYIMAAHVEFIKSKVPAEEPDTEAG